MPIASEKVEIIGAGLVGSLLSIVLAKRGFSVDLYERRPDMRRVNIGAGRSINLALSVRGLNALKEVGLEGKILERAIPMRGRLMHSVTGELTFQAYGIDDSQVIYSVSRGELNKTLLTAAEATGKVKIHFESKRESATPGVRTFGTDGSASALRRAMGVTASESALDYGYKELEIGGEFQLEKNALHIWPRGTFMLIALPNYDGSFTCTLFLPLEGCNGFDKLKTPTDVEALFEKEFPDALKLLPGLAEQFFEHPTGHMVTVKCSSWHQRDQVLLMGDAAHAIVPFFGQGMNCGFEDVSEFSRMIEDSKNWESLFSSFSASRKPNSDAIADMAVENFLEMRDKVGDAAFLLEKEVEKVLQRKFPGKYVSRYSLVSFSQAPYREALLRGELNARILSELCAGISVASEVDLKKAEKLINASLPSGC